MTRRYNKNDPTGAGHGARQAPSMLVSRKRYRQRAEGKIPPVEYRPEFLKKGNTRRPACKKTTRAITYAKISPLFSLAKVNYI